MCQQNTHKFYRVNLDNFFSIFKAIHNTSVQFEVKEYGKIAFVVFICRWSILTFNFYFLSVLPKFSVKLTVPPYILKTDNLIKINVTAR